MSQFDLAPRRLWEVRDGRREPGARAKAMEDSIADQLIGSTQGLKPKSTIRIGKQVSDSSATENERDALRAAYIAILAWQRPKTEGGRHG